VKLTRAQLRKRMRWTPARLTELLADGLPWHREGKGKSFFADEIVPWLVNAGLAKPRDETPRPPAGSQVDPDDCTIATTKSDAAQLLGVTTRTVSDWQAYADFPGRPGRKGRRDAYYPIEAIQAWRENTFAKAEDGNDTPELVRARAEQLAESTRGRRLKNDALEGKLLPADLVERSAAELTGRIRTRLEAIPDETEMMFPVDLRLDIKTELENKIYAILLEMSQWTPPGLDYATQEETAGAR